jgi:hypothetical protein
MSRPEVFDSRWKDDIVTTIETSLRHGCHGFTLVHLVDIDPAYSSLQLTINGPTS